MILAMLAGASLVVAVAVDHTVETPRRDAGNPQSLSQKTFAVQPLIRSATECVVRSVSADPRLAAAGQVDLNELIVNAMEGCAEAMRDMIDAYDRNFGAGSGQTFFLGPYLDVLPIAIHSRIEKTAPARTRAR